MATNGRISSLVMAAIVCVAGWSCKKAKVGPCGDMRGLQRNAPWAMFRRCPTHTGRSDHVDTGTLKIKWTFRAAGMIHSSPVVGGDGTVYFGSDDQNLYALNPGGTLKWKFDTGGFVYRSPAIGADGTLHLGSCAANSDGTLRWQAGGSMGPFPPQPLVSSPAIGPDGTIYYGACARYPDGTLKWGQCGGLSSSPAIGPDGMVFVSDVHTLEALNPADGTRKWRLHTGSYMSSPAVAQDGTVYLTAQDVDSGNGMSSNSLYAVNPDGSLRWKLHLPGEGHASLPAIANDGTTYVTRSSYLYAVNLDGTIKWDYDCTTAAGLTSPVVGGDGTIYVGGDAFLAVTADGHIKQRVELRHDYDDHVTTSPAIGADGTIYFGSLEGKLYAVGSGESNGGEDHPPREGVCGMEGQWIWCHEDFDCYSYAGYGNTCDFFGTCFHSIMDAYYCELPWGMECMGSDRFCNWQGLCTARCATHEDCPGGLCMCRDGVSLCLFNRCTNGACPPNTIPLEGTLACEPEPGYLEGECHHFDNEVCDPGYQPAGERGCVRIQ